MHISNIESTLLSVGSLFLKYIFRLTEFSVSANPLSDTYYSTESIVSADYKSDCDRIVRIDRLSFIINSERDGAEVRDYS